MADGKKSFIAYVDWIQTFEELEDDEAGRLVKHLWRYVNDLNPITEDKLIKMCFIPIKAALKRDLVKYDSIIDRNRINGSKGGRPKKPKKPSGLTVNPKEPKKPDSDSDSDSDSDMPKKYIYSAFYDAEIENSGNDENYILLVKFLYGKNSLNAKMNGILGVENQLTFLQFKHQLERCKEQEMKMGDILTGIENKPKYYKDSSYVSRIISTWITNNKMYSKK